MSIMVWTLVIVTIIAAVATVYIERLPTWACILLGNGLALAVWLAFLFGGGL